ncbi:CotO family spore coat protein [Halobacillus sp. SY10]|uniref:CotO family spore coat protein n=1 Tax=Halobacillus sp. SY10 TaxID=3381356 RepID=UPI003879F219
MADEKRLAKQPMLYIVQPKGLKPAEVPMQTSFRSQRSSKAEEKTEQPPAEAPSTEREIRMRSQNSPHRQELAKLKTSDEPEMSGEERGGDASAVSAEEKVEKDAPRDRRQRFHDMTLEEKVLYFFNLSPHVPKMKCEVMTEEENYRGYITDYVGGVVHMKVFQRPFQREIAFEAIQDIRLLGF